MNPLQNRRMTKNYFNLDIFQAHNLDVMCLLEWCCCFLVKPARYNECALRWQSLSCPYWVSTLCSRALHTFGKGKSAWATWSWHIHVSLSWRQILTLGNILFFNEMKKIRMTLEFVLFPNHTDIYPQPRVALSSNVFPNDQTFYNVVELR